MWCTACRADVAAELSQDSRHFRCARCGLELGIAKGALGSVPPAPVQPTDAERNARELLARWNAQNLLTAPAVARPAIESPVPLAESLAVSRPSLKAESALENGDANLEEVTSTVELDRRRPPRKTRRRDRSSQSNVLREPPPTARKTSLGGTVGQLCAYFGIGLITCGTSVVLWGFFGGPENFAPTGWLITTIGQMFLFLGVVTLISSSMEQTSAEVAGRIDALGQRLIRIELLQREQSPSGPHRRRKRSTPSSAMNEPRTADAA